MTRHLCAFALVLGWTAVASAQGAPNVECRKTETQAECHARLKCKADEEVEDCQKRLLRCNANEDLATCKKRAAAQGNQGNQGSQDHGQRDDDRDRDDNRRDRERDDRDDNRRDRDHDRDDDGRDDNRSRDRDDRRGSRGRGRGHRSQRHGRQFEANKTFGLGFELGEPTGFNGKYFFGPRTALDFGLGWIYSHYYYGDGAHVYADILFHPVSLASNESFELPFYVGGGLRFWDFDYCYMGQCDYGGSAVGIRVPLGISFDFNNAPLDIFMQLVPTLDFLRGNYYDRYRDRNHFGVDGSVGLRFWFK